MQGLCISSCFAYVEAILRISTTLANCNCKVGVSNRIDGQVQCNDTVATVDGLQVLCICSRFAYIETVLCVARTLANRCRKVGICNRVDGQVQSYNAVATVDGLQVPCISTCFACVEAVFGISTALADDMAYCLRINSSFEVRYQCRILRYPNGARIVCIVIAPCDKAITRCRSGSQNPLITSLSIVYINTTHC